MHLITLITNNPNSSVYNVVMAYVNSINAPGHHYSMGVPAPLEDWLRTMGIKLPKAKVSSLNEELERAGICGCGQPQQLLRLSNKQLKLYLPSLNLGDRVIVRTCAESVQGITLLAHYMKDLVIRLQRSPSIMSAELLSAFESRGDEDEDQVRWSHAQLELRAQGIRRLPVLLSVALMDDGEEKLINCGLRAGEIANMAVCARSEYGEQIMASWKKTCGDRLSACFHLRYTTDENASDAECDTEELARRQTSSTTNRRPEVASVEPQSGEASARNKRAAEDVERTESAKRHNAQGGTVGDRFNQSDRANEFALIKIENADTNAISIELVKITQKGSLSSESEFKGTMYLCTRVQTSEDCLHASWYVSQTRNSPFDPDSVICYFPALNHSGKLPAKAKNAAFEAAIFSPPSSSSAAKHGTFFLILNTTKLSFLYYYCFRFA